jgi:hypothetical protein
MHSPSTVQPVTRVGVEEEEETVARDEKNFEKKEAIGNF